MHKIKDYVLDNLLTILWVHLVLDNWLKQTLCFSCFVDIILESFGNVPMNINRPYGLTIILGLFNDHYVTTKRI